MIQIIKEMLDNVLDSVIKRDETLIFFPTIGSFDSKEGAWIVDIHAWIFEPEEDSRFRNEIIERFGKILIGEKIEGEPFESRARMFLVDNERNKKITIRFGDKQFKIKETTNDNGQLKSQIILSEEEVKRLQQESGSEEWIIFQAVLPDNDNRVFKGVVQLLRPQGISVISDIDDTIKVSEVTHPDRKTLLRNTFVNEFKPIEGMAEIYSEWKKKGMRFHYLSGSPWQLFVPLTEFIHEAGFPMGSMHLREFSWDVEDLLRFFSSPEDYKKNFIEEFINRFPERRLILVGDSGEVDEEIYRDIYLKYRNQIQKILIRNIKSNDSGSGLSLKVFRNVPNQKWTIFEEPSELKWLDLVF
ncbi:MAG: phosphatidate phosphatase App1 family protein [Thermodesulfobacteriota bacterium]